MPPHCMPFYPPLHHIPHPLLLKVHTKVFISRDQEAKWKANRKMKRKVDLLQQPLLNSQMSPRELIQSEAEAICHPKDGKKCPQITPALGRN
jgi:hypothetical protein